MKKLVLCLLVGVGAVSAWAQPAAPENSKPEILIVGTYHMDNPGRDLYNTKADDVLTAERQKEIAEVVAVLKKFKPTKVAIEADPGSQRVAREYAGYLAGKFALTRNEIDQLGYRTAKEMGHKAVYPVDEEGDFPYLRVKNFAKANGKGEEFDKLVETQWGAPAKAENDYLHGHTILETLTRMNSDERAAEGVAGYFAIVPYAEPGEYAGPDLIAAWYQRNIRIYSNIRRLVESPGERILVIYGAGHLGWLQQDVANDATVRLRKLAEFTEKK